MSSGDRKRGLLEHATAGKASQNLTYDDIMGNPGLLKLELLLCGLRMDPQLLADLIQSRGPSAFATAFELDLTLPEGTSATVPVDPSLTRESPYELVKDSADDETQYRIVAETGSVPVSLTPPPFFYSKQTESGVPLGRFATLHGSYLALSPISECQFLGSADQCKFCSLSVSPRLPVYELIDAVKAAQEERAIQMIYLSVGYIEGPDSGVAALEPYVRALKKSFNVLVAVDALPPSDDRWIDRTYAMGVDSVSYNMEIFDPQAFEQICPGPAKHIGRQRFLDALSYATTVFNPGAVICHLVVGMEPVASTLAGIDELVGRNVVPVLPTYRPFKGVDLRGVLDAPIPKLDTEELSQVYAHLYQRLREYNIPMGWVRDISVVTTPMEGRFFVGEKTRLVRFMDRLFNDPHRKPFPRLVDWRRSLRVKETPS
mgnify:CR=1 FL=1